MMNIVICCDGTWNTPDQKDGAIPVPTNVVRLLNALAAKDKNGNEQRQYYHPGVGTDGSWWSKVVDGSTGQGLDHNIKSAYYELSRRYSSGDAIFLFGFSRGAYTVRSLAGFIGHCGLLDTAALSSSQAWDQIENAFRKGYRNRTDWRQADYKFHTSPDGSSEIPIRFLGVWDTVGALGIPEDMGLLHLIDNLHDYSFHDTSLSRHVEVSRHAVALDELRASFQPTLWTATPQQDAKQVWFPGVHSDVGGGYREHGLSDGALLWMIGEAAAAGLAFNPQVTAQIKDNPLDVIHDSCCGVFSLLPTMPRSVPDLSQNSSELAPSVKTRMTTPLIDRGRYRPQAALPLDIQVFAVNPWNETGLWLEAGKTYHFSATGEWQDSRINCGPAGGNAAKFQLGKVAYALGSAMGVAEEWFKKLTGNESANFYGSRRNETVPWFCLTGAIANGGGSNPKGRVVAHETFAIGDKCAYTPIRSGYLYLYANDAWGFYGNNRGHVRLSVT